MPKDLWVCYDRAIPTVIKFAHEDESDSTYTCEKLSVIRDVTSIGYHLFRVFQFLLKRPPVIEP